MGHRVYKSIVKEIKEENLVEPFTKLEFQACCPGLGNGTYNDYLNKHAVGNRRHNPELFERVGPGQFRCLRPFKYGLSRESKIQ